MNKTEACLLLNHIFYLSVGKLRHFLKLSKFEPEEIFKTSKTVLSANFNENIANKIIKLEKSKYLDHLFNNLNKYNISYITSEDEDYPDILKEIYDYPIVLFLKGNKLSQNLHALSVVGTRKASEYGKQVAFQISKELSTEGISIVSGLARGIDAKAHGGAIEGSGNTIAVMGCGLDKIYPVDNNQLSQSILERGTLISEFAPLVQPLPSHFPYRNRIISGLSKGVLVVEAAQKSGSIITAMSALDQNRLVYAVPGRICDKSFDGCNYLIKSGAKLVTDSMDILQDYGIEKPTKANLNLDKLKITDVEREILNCISIDPIHLDVLKERCQFGDNLNKISFSLLQLEIKKIIKRLPGDYFVSCIMSN